MHRRGPLRIGERLLLVISAVALLLSVVVSIARAQEEIEGARGAIVVDAPLTTPQVAPIIVDRQQWFTPLIGGFVAFVGVAFTVGAALMWQVFRRVKASTDLVVAVAKANEDRAKERAVEKVAMAVEKVAMDAKLDRALAAPSPASAPAAAVYPTTVEGTPIVTAPVVVVPPPEAKP